MAAFINEVTLSVLMLICHGTTKQTSRLWWSLVFW